MTWLENEQNIIRREMRRKCRFTTETVVFTRLLMLLIPLALFLACTSPKINAAFETAYEGGLFFPDTWFCKKCGYENFDGITTCPICGKGK